jgi:hypothetical protein
MDDFLRNVYLKVVGDDCEMCLRAIIATKHSLLSEGEDDDTFTYLRTFIHYSAAVSRMFWPPGSGNKASRQRSENRGTFLRTALGIPDDHPLHSRTLRNHLEHFDERLDDWAESSAHRNIIVNFLGPRASVVGIIDQDIIHHYDPATHIYSFRGAPFDIRALADAVTDVYERIKALEKR